MNTKDFLHLLDPRNQNLPAIEFKGNFKGCDLIFVPVFEDEEKLAKKAYPVPLLAKLSGKKNEKLQLVKNNQIIKLIGVGPREKLNSRSMRRFFGSAYLSATQGKPKSIGMDVPFEWIKEAANGILVAALNPGLLKTKAKKEKAPLVVFGSASYAKNMAEAKKALKSGVALAQGKNLMRVLGALPPNLLQPQPYADLVEELADQWGVECKRLTVKELEPYGLMKAVSAGSDQRSELLILTLHPKSGPTSKSVAVIGKGLCFDAGGLQVKGVTMMKWMKEDMAGSASVLGTVLTIVKGGLEVKETTHFMLALAENKLGDKAMRPDDVFTAGDGQTVEIGNTDAEGRLVLADAICYAKKNLKGVEKYITIATLTGHCVIALGEVYTGLFCNKPEWEKSMEDLGKATGDYMHAFPWDEEYDDNTSPNADLSNAGDNSRDAGAINAAMFIYRFVPKAKNEKSQAAFCHLDIAGSIDMYEKGRPWRLKGLNSGVGVALLSKLVTE